MRIGVVLRVIAKLLWFTLGTLCVPFVVSLFTQDGCESSWIISILLCGALALVLPRLQLSIREKNLDLRRRESFMAVCLSWLVLVFFTSFAFHLSGEFTNFAQAFFESMSGFTTTGATVIAEIEALPSSILFMRSWSHWIGGMGIIVLSVAILPELALGGMQLFSAESSGIRSDKLAPRIAATARRLWLFYVGITFLLTLLLVPGGMSLFDAVNHSMATIGTGGFSTKNQSISGFNSLYIELVILVFMWISGLSFTLQYRALIQKQPKKLLNNPEVRLYFVITFVAIGLTTLNVYASGQYISIFETLRYTSFQVVSVITTTGFGTANFDAWPEFSRMLLVVLMFIGGCAGSTAGGSKVIRLYIIFKHTVVQIRRSIRPRLIQPIRVGKRDIAHKTTEAILGYYLLYFAIITILGLALTALGMDLVSGSTAAISAMNSIGPGLGSVGATQNFSEVPQAGLYLLSGGMLLGRLEIYPLLVIFSSHFWRNG